jgi:hypothetical protein
LIITDKGIIIISKRSSTSSKMRVDRADFAHDAISDITLTTAGMGITDLGGQISWNNFDAYNLITNIR